jgi:branched-chain amino acid transport system permease protein
MAEIKTQSLPGSAAPKPIRPATKNAQERNKILILSILAVFFLVLPFILEPVLAIFGPTTFTVTQSSINITLIFVLLAVGLNIVVGYAGLLDLGYAAFFAIGAYTMAFLTSSQSPLYNTPLHTNFWVALPLSFGMAALFGILLGAPTLGLRGDYLAIVTLGFGEIVPITFNNLNTVTGGNSGLGGLEQPSFFGFHFTASTLTAWYIIALLVLYFSIFMIRRLVDSRIGRAWMAMREDEIAASSMGINLVKTKLLAFSLGASFAGFAGGIYANSLGTANPSSFQFDVSVLVLSMIILGGMGNIWGVIAGAVALAMSDRYIIPFLTEQVRKVADGITLNTTLVNGVRTPEPNLIKEILTNVGGNSRLLIFGTVLVVMMLFKPEGLFPSGRRKMELHAGAPDDPQPFVGGSSDPLDKADSFHSLSYNPSVTEETEETDEDRKDNQD